ncbi:MAG: outer membrane beta-barrel protein [Alphaproteobacteria bacterium]|jgi:opacity protein-like surface antigen|nr:outer membrane beta-barrel protein [Alphaproteobacteria bacterium]
MVRAILLVLLAVAFAPLANAREADPPADFAGAFVGLNTGYAFGASGDWCYCTFLPSVADATEGEGGIIVGGEAGYGVRLGPIVIEAAARASHADVQFSEICGIGLPCSGQAGWIGEAQISAGFVLFGDILFAGTWGYAVADVDTTIGLDASNATHDGIVLAARIEQAMTENWRMGLEYRQYDMQGTNGTPAGDVDIDWQTEAVALTIHYELD